MLEVPYMLRHIAKAHGARFDVTRRVWWLPEGVEATGLQALLTAGGGANRPTRASTNTSPSIAPTPMPSAAPMTTRASPSIAGNMSMAMRTSPNAPTPMPAAAPMASSGRSTGPINASAVVEPMSPVTLRGLTDIDDDDDEPVIMAAATTSEAVNETRPKVSSAVWAMVAMFIALTAIGVPFDANVAIMAIAASLRHRLLPIMEHAGQAVERVGTYMGEVEETGRRHSGAIAVVIILVALMYRATALNRVHHQHGVALTKGMQLAAYTAINTPRADLLTASEARQLYLELLAGHDGGDGLPNSIARALVIVDTGCARSMGNHRDQFKLGSMRAHKTEVAGASGSFTTAECGEIRLPVETVGHGMRMFREKDAIFNPNCAYVLISVGRASIEQGVQMTMPAWGEAGTILYPNGVAITVHNRRVLVLRPIGYKQTPLPTLAGITPSELGIPGENKYILYLGSGPHRDTDLGHQLRESDKGRRASSND